MSLWSLYPRAATSDRRSAALCFGPRPNLILFLHLLVGAVLGGVVGIALRLHHLGLSLCVCGCVCVCVHVFISLLPPLPFLSLAPFLSHCSLSFFLSLAHFPLSPSPTPVSLPSIFITFHSFSCPLFSSPLSIAFSHVYMAQSHSLSPSLPPYSLAPDHQCPVR